MLYKILFKLGKVKQYLKGWGFNLSGSRKKRKQVILDLLMGLEEMEEARPLNIEQMKQQVDLIVELYNILDEEELIWFKISLEAWLLKGDNNTEYFHIIVNGKKRKQIIFSLQTEEGIVSGTDNLLQHATYYYRTLFGPRNGDAFDLDASLWSELELVNEQENADLTK
jgi:hypothetical protein